MSIFTGTLNYTSKLHYLFTTDNQDFMYVGLPQFTLPSLYSHCKNNYKEIEQTSINSTLKTLFISAKDKNETEFLTEFYTIIKSIYYYKFNLSSKTYDKETIDNDKMKDLIDKFEVLKTKENYNDRDTLTSVRDIQNSAYGYLQLDLTFNETVGGESFPVNLRLYFKDNTDALTGERVLAQKASNLMTGVPRRATGAKYGAKNTNNPKDKESKIGQYSSPSENDDKNVTNMVSGPLKMSFNKSLGAWESGTQQLLAKLLTDIDKASIKNVSISLTDNAEGKDFYLSDSDNYMGGFTTGVAMPLSVEDGNPHLFGPNCITCGGEQKIEKIRVVNRAPRSFKKGSIVMCSQIDGEWIIQDFGNSEDAAPAKSVIKEWSFIKLIANSDVYFKDNRYLNDDGTVNSNYRINISPDTYANKMRYRFYADVQAVNGGDGFEGFNSKINLQEFSIDIPKLVKYNLYPDVSGRELNAHPGNYGIPSSKDEILGSTSGIVPNQNYFVSTIFDQLGSHMGGNQDTNFIQKTNVSNTTSSKLELAGSAFPFFWGPVFVEGYQSQDVNRVKNYASNSSISISNAFNNAWFLDYFSLSETSNPFKLGNAFLANGDMFEGDNTNAKELPAEVGVLSSGSPIEVMPLLFSITGNDFNLLKLSDINPLKEKFVNLTTPSGVDIYNMKPISPNKIQFSPLQAEFAAHSDLYSKYTVKPNNFDRNFYDSTRQLLKSNYSSVGHFWGKMFGDRSGSNIDDKYEYPTCDTYNQSIMIRQNFYNVPYDCYIKSIPTSKPIGTPLLFSDTNSQYSGANLVGVIAAKNRFKRTGGGKLTIDLEQNFGLVSYKTISGGQVDPISWVGVLLGGSSNALRQNSNPQWGSDNSDSYDSFGTTAMHVRVFDAWPKEQTIHDARYFSVLHFNPGRPFSTCDSTHTGVTPLDLEKKHKDVFIKWFDSSSTKYYHKVPPSNFDYSRDIDQIEYSVDFRVPTYSDLTQSNFSVPENDNKVIPVGTDITKDIFIRPETEWRVNTIRRGQLLTKGGFRYFQSVIGLNDANEIIEPGLGFTNDQIVTLTKGVRLKVKVDNSEGKITGFEFDKDDDDNEYRGIGFLPSDFSRTEKIKDVDKTGYFLKIPGPKPAEIYFPKGVVYSILKRDDGPQERCPITRLSSSSNRGEGVVDTTQTTILDIEANTSGEYDAFYHFHNDITHTLMFSYGQIPGFYQYVIMNIN